MRIKSPLKIIHKEGLVDFDIEVRNGARFIIAGNFKQMIKESEFKQILAHSVDVVKEEVKEIEVKNVEAKAVESEEVKRPRGRPRKTEV